LDKLKAKVDLASGRQRQQLELIMQQLQEKTTKLADLQAVLRPIRKDDQIHGN
jgi:ABC-type uncharacterized transport system ATPase component